MFIYSPEEAHCVICMGYCLHVAGLLCSYGERNGLQHANIPCCFSQCFQTYQYFNNRSLLTLYPRTHQAHQE